MLLFVDMLRPYDEVERIANHVIGCAIEVHRVLGPGLLESVYHDCLRREFHLQGLRFESGFHVPIDYKGMRVDSALVVDLLVEERVVVELKAVEQLHPVHEAQVITYLKLTGCPAGLLMNFNAVLLKQGLRRLDHPDRYRKNNNPE
jgi:GxxExxY protein